MRNMPAHYQVLPFLWLASIAWGQAPTGEIAGRIYDSTGAVVPDAAVSIRSAATGGERNASTNREGSYSFGALAAGTYEMQASAAGFRTTALNADVVTGAVTTVDIRLEVGERKDVVNVDAATPQMEYERHTIDQVVG